MQLCHLQAFCAVYSLGGCLHHITITDRGAGMLWELHLLPLNVFCLSSSLCALRPPRKGSQTQEVQLSAPVDEHLHCQPAGLTRVLQLDNLARGI